MRLQVGSTLSQIAGYLPGDVLHVPPVNYLIKVNAGRVTDYATSLIVIVMIRTIMMTVSLTVRKTTYNNVINDGDNNTFNYGNCYDDRY